MIRFTNANASVRMHSIEMGRSQVTLTTTKTTTAAISVFWAAGITVCWNNQPHSIYLHTPLESAPSLIRSLDGAAAAHRGTNSGALGLRAKLGATELVWPLLGVAASWGAAVAAGGAAGNGLTAGGPATADAWAGPCCRIIKQLL